MSRDLSPEGKAVCSFLQDPKAFEILDLLGIRG